MEGRQNCHKTCGQKVERKKKKLKKMQLKADRCIRRQTEEVKKLRRQLKGLETEARQTEDDCESTIVGVIDSLQRSFESLRRTIGAQQREAAASGQRCLKALLARLRKVKRRKAELQRLATMDDDAAFLKQWPQKQRLCRVTLDAAPCSTWAEPHAQFELIKRTVDDLGRKMTTLCEEGFPAITPSDQQEPERRSSGEAGDNMQRASSSPTAGPSGIHGDLSVEPRTREDFLQYACNLTFDVTTAHQDLLVSAGGREVRLWSNSAPAPRRPLSFLRRRQLLCRDALRAARCYYEVEVEGDHAEIALAYQSMDRKSLSQLSAFGGNNKSWSLDRSRFYSVSHNGDSMRLVAQPACKRVGVYLQLHEGLLSFYEVADAMTLLHRVEANFVEPLYPGFWLGEKCCIRICDL